MKNSSMLQLLRRLYPERMAPVSEGLDNVCRMIAEELPCVTREYPSGDEHNGWVVPQKWGVRKAEIRKDGKLIYDGAVHPLGVAGYSQPFKGRLKLAELKKHLFFREGIPDVLPYHCELFYKVGRKDWGFCMTKNDIEKLPEGEYDVELDTYHEDGTMKVSEYHLPGASPETIILNGHSCHAGQANDDIAGVVVAIEVMKRLAKRKNHYSYRLVVAPEHFGTVFYLKNIPAEELATFKCAMFLEMLGSNTPHALQLSFTGQHEIDRAAKHWFQHRAPGCRVDAFRKVVGNDETVWEAPGYEVPTISISRFPYPEYHTSKDTDAIIFEEKLEESAAMVMEIIDTLETNVCFQRRFTGLVALSNPKYDLYIGTSDPSIPIKVGEEQKLWNYLMDCIPRYFDGKTPVLDIAERHGIRHQQVYGYVERFEQKGLVSRVPRRRPAPSPVAR